MSARSAVLTPSEEAAPIRIQIGATTRTFTAAQYARMLALLSENLADPRGMRRERAWGAMPATRRPLANRTLWEVADVVVPGVIWIAGLLFAAGAFAV